jgi:nucleotide-binding universal stress UspA family protein
LTDTTHATSSPEWADPFVSDAINHVLFGTDGSQFCLRALAWAKGIARFWEADVTVVCGFDSPKSFRKRGSLYLTEARDALEAEAREIVAEAVAKIQADQIQAQGVAFEGGPVDAILETADQVSADIIVIGGGGREGARDYLVGSVAERVVRHASVPVLIAR